jgi:ribonuclease BN (tRNA processing enzyme)
VRLTVVGCSPSWPSPGEALSGYHLALPEGALLLDFGNGVLARLRASDLAPPAAIVLSHLHPDHLADVFALCFGLYDGELAWAPPTLYAPPGGRVQLEEICQAYGFELRTLEAAFPVREYRSATPLPLLGAELRFARTTHTSHSYLIRVEADGRSLCFTGDTPAVPAVPEHARGCDLFLCEATAPAPGDRSHLTPAEAAAFARDAGVGRMLLTHLPAARRETAVAEARRIFARVEAAQPDLALSP